MTIIYIARISQRKYLILNAKSNIVWYDIMSVYHTRASDVRFYFEVFVIFFKKKTNRIIIITLWIRSTGLKRYDILSRFLFKSIEILFFIIIHPRVFSRVSVPRGAARPCVLGAQREHDPTDGRIITISQNLRSFNNNIWIISRHRRRTSDANTRVFQYRVMRIGARDSIYKKKKKKKKWTLYERVYGVIEMTPKWYCVWKKKKITTVNEVEIALYKSRIYLYIQIFTLLRMHTARASFFLRVPVFYPPVSFVFSERRDNNNNNNTITSRATDTGTRVKSNRMRLYAK